LFPGELLAAILPRGHALEGKRRIGAGDVEEETLVTYPRAENPLLYDQLIGMIEAAGYRFGHKQEASSASERDLLLAVSEGGGIGLVPDSFEEAASLVRLPLDPPVSMPPTVIAWRADPPPGLERAVALLREVTRSLWADQPGRGE
jgi:hypothetical protein